MQQQNLDSGRIRKVRRISGDVPINPEEDDVPKGSVWAEPLDATADKAVHAEKSMKRGKNKIETREENQAKDIKAPNATEIRIK